MAAVKSREEYFDTGFAVLAELGYGGLKLAEVCKRLGVTTGSFYHHFASWPIYTHQLAQHWVDTQTMRNATAVRAEPDPQRRVEQLIQLGMGLQHETESAIRAWGAVNPDVRAMLATVDQERFDVMRETAAEILGDARLAQRFASWATYVRIGYQQALIPRDPDALRWTLDQMTETFYSDRYAGAIGG